MMELSNQEHLLLSSLINELMYIQAVSKGNVAGVEATLGNVSSLIDRELSDLPEDLKVKLLGLPHWKR